MKNHTGFFIENVMWISIINPEDSFLMDFSGFIAFVIKTNSVIIFLINKYISYLTIQNFAYLRMNVAIITNDLVFVVVVYCLKLYISIFGKLISCYSFFVKKCLQIGLYHFNSAIAQNRFRY